MPEVKQRAARAAWSSDFALPTPTRPPFGRRLPLTDLPASAATTAPLSWYARLDAGSRLPAHQVNSQSALFNFQSLLLVILLLICTCTYVRATMPTLIDRNKEG